MRFTLLLLLICSWASAQQGSAGSFRSTADTVTHPLTLRQFEGIWMAPASELGHLLTLDTRYQPGAQRLLLGKSAWIIDNPWVGLGDTALHMKVAPRFWNGGLWLPLPDALEPLQKATGTALTFDSTRLRIETSPRKDAVRMELQQMDNGEMLELRFNRTTRAESFHNAPHFILRLEGTILDTAQLSDLLKKSELIARIQPIQEKKLTQLTLLPRNACASVELLRRDNGKTWQILLRRKSPTSSSSMQASSSSTHGKGKIRTIVLDPGHGGKDPGAIGIKGLQEKEVVLRVAKKLKSKLEAQGFKVRLTRDDDTFVELPERPAMASKWEGDLFISLHCNAVDGAARQKKAEGFKFYILREAESEEDKAIARRENKAIELSASKKGKNEISPVEWILLENQLNMYTKESERFAGYLVDSYEGGQIKKMSSGAGQAGFMVLVGAFMPAVLVEIGFITHPEDAAWMGSSQGQEDIANRLAKAIKAYNKSIGN